MGQRTRQFNGNGTAKTSSKLDSFDRALMQRPRGFQTGSVHTYFKPTPRSFLR